MRKTAILASIVAASLLPAATAAAQSASTIGPVGPPISPVGPKQYFHGLVDGQASESTIVLACPPIGTSRTGHPVAGQSVSVHQLFPPIVFPGLGYTGTASTIAASLRLVSASAAASATSALPLAVFSLYDARVAIPTTLSLPCSGSGAVVFQPVQGGSTAQNDTVKVTFASITATT